MLNPAVLFLGYLIVLFGGSLFVKVILRKVSSRFIDDGNSGMVKASFYIGVLEIYNLYLRFIEPVLCCCFHLDC